MAVRGTRGGDRRCVYVYRIERHSKLILAWHLGKRTRVATEEFIAKLRTATADSRFQVSTDGFGPYVNAINDGLSDRDPSSEGVRKNETGRDAATALAT